MYRLDDLYPPVRQAPGWTWFAVGLIAAVVVWWAVLLWRARRRPASATWAPLRGDELVAARRAYLVEIDAVVDAWRHGLPVRDAFQRLSPLIRRFAFEASGLPAHTMSLADLEREHPGALVEAVATMYPSEFATAVSGDVLAGADRARRFVLEWSPVAEAAPRPTPVTVRP